jgi:hypothetical protein
MSCGLQVRGFILYRCSNRSCSHTKRICFSCNSRSCPTCGKRAIDHWSEKAVNLFPDCSYQHITFTMPDVLWHVFKDHRECLNRVMKLAIGTLIKLAKKKGITIGVFAALHTHGRQMTWNTHVHASVTMGGLDKHGKWHDITFKKDAVMKMWRYAVITMMRELVAEGYTNITSDVLTTQYERPWIVHFEKPTKDYKHTMAYIGRYTKKPPIAMSKIKHFDSESVTFDFLNHRTKKFNTTTISMEEFLDRFLQHIPEKFFKMTRYYGLFATAVRGKYLPKLFKIFNQTLKNVALTTYQQMSLLSFGHDPLRCIVCGSQLVSSTFVAGKTIAQFMDCHMQLATRKRMPL